MAMRPKAGRAAGLAGAALLAAFGGCATPAIVMRYAPASQAVPLDAKVRPKLFLERVEDRTGGADVSFGGLAAWKHVSPPDVALREALQLELDRLGLAVVPSRDRADVLLRASWVRGPSAANQISHAYHDKGHGLFTYHLLKEVKARAGRGEVDWRPIFDAAAPQVSNIARREYNADQFPEWKGP